MKVKLLCFGISKEITGQFEQTIELSEDFSVGGLRAELLKKFPDFLKLNSLKFALDGEYASEDAPLSPNAEVVLIPPVSGG